MGKVCLIVGILGISLGVAIFVIPLLLGPQGRRFLKLMFLFSVLPTLISCSTSKWAGTYVGDAKLAAMSGTSAIATGQASGVSLTITESSGQHYLDIGDGGAIKNCRMRVRPQYNPAGGGETEAFTTEFDLA